MTKEELKKPLLTRTSFKIMVVIGNLIIGLNLLLVPDTISTIVLRLTGVIFILSAFIDYKKIKLKKLKNKLKNL